MKHVTLARAVALSTWIWAGLAISQSQPPANTAEKSSPGARYSAPNQSHVNQAISAAFANSDAAHAEKTDPSMVTGGHAHGCSTDPTPMARACRDMPGATDGQGKPIANDANGRASDLNSQSLIR